jgi:hypothetical protein
MTKQKSARIREPDHTVLFRLGQVRRDFQAKKGRDYTWQEVAEGAGLHVNTVYDIASNRATRVDLATLGCLVDFFHNEGMPIGVGDLFETVPPGHKGQEQSAGRRDEASADSASNRGPAS